jgi:hypothetical protein
MTNAIYLDGFATLPFAPEAKEAMLSAWTNPGNAGSANLAGELAARTIADGRQSGCDGADHGQAKVWIGSGLAVDPAYSEKDQGCRHRVGPPYGKNNLRPPAGRHALQVKGCHSSLNGQEMVRAK